MEALTDRGRYILTEIRRLGAARRYSAQSQYRGVAQALHDLGLVRPVGRCSYEITARGLEALRAQ